MRPCAYTKPRLHARGLRLVTTPSAQAARMGRRRVSVDLEGPTSIQSMDDPRNEGKPITEEFLRALPKTDVHLHLDGSVRIQTLIDLAKKEGVELPAYTVEGLKEKVFKAHYNDLFEYLQGFAYVGQVLQNAENLERVSYECGIDCFSENCRYIEVRFAPQLHANESLDVPEVLRAVDRGLRRARDEFNQQDAIVAGTEPPFEYGLICTAMRMFDQNYSSYFRDLCRVHKFAPPERLQAMASEELARAAVHIRNTEGLPIVGFDLAGSEHGYEAKIHNDAFDYCMRHFMNRTVHAGEAFGPESIFQAISRCHAERIGHGYHLFNTDYVTATDVVPDKFVRDLAEYIADQRITIEVCLTSNTNTLPELRDNPEGLKAHAFGKMLEKDLSVTLCTDNRTFSHTDVTKEYFKAVQNFDLTLNEVRRIVLNGFWSSFNPWRDYEKKKQYIQQIMAYYDAVEHKYGFHRHAELRQAIEELQISRRFSQK